MGLVILRLGDGLVLDNIADIHAIGLAITMLRNFPRNSKSQIKNLLEGLLLSAGAAQAATTSL